MSENIVTLASVSRHEQEIKRSRFVGVAGPLAKAGGFDAFLDRHKVADAHQNCWAWRHGKQYRFDDDGEPGGTSGRPILAAIDGAGLDQVAVLVARYFGGTKLGTGGLARAYGGTAAKCLDLALRKTVWPRTRIEVLAGFDQLGCVHQAIEQFAARKMDEQYQTSGVLWRLSLRSDWVQCFTRQLQESTSGDVRIRRIESDSSPHQPT